MPQLLKNVRFAGGKPLEHARVQAVIRVMAEGDDAGQVEQVVDAICDAVREAA